ncbi:MAG: Crp/Fnr family transcriptional regulator [Planctomycetes bacterium]|nr:Crp/Fnr family transcriptional regulator [Planctomycetota bacterium]
MKNPDYCANCSGEYERILKQVPLFSGLSPLDLERVSRLVVRRKFRKGQLIISEGQELEGFYIVISGQVKVYKLSPDGKQQIIHLVGPGGTFAEAAAFTKGFSPANASATIDSEVFFLFKNDLVKLIRDNPQISLNMLASMSQYLRHMVTVIEELALKDVPARLAKYLLDSAPGQVTEIKLVITKKELASRLGTISETFSRTLNKFKSKRVIKVSGNRIAILNKARLEEIAAGLKP